MRRVVAAASPSRMMTRAAALTIAVRRSDAVRYAIRFTVHLLVVVGLQGSSVSMSLSVRDTLVDPLSARCVPGASLPLFGISCSLPIDASSDPP